MEGLFNRGEYLRTHTGTQKVLEVFTTVLSDRRNSRSKAAIILGDIGFNERFKLKKGLILGLGAVFGFKPFFCFKTNIFEVSLLSSSLACCSQNCWIFRNRYNLYFTVRNCFSASKISSSTLSLFRRVLFYFLKSITRLHCRLCL